MKIVDRKTFLFMPPETVFCKYFPCVFEEMRIKLDTFGDDFTYQGVIGEIECHSGYERIDDLFRSIETGESLTMCFDDVSRDGCFDEDQLFAVLERQDVANLISRLAKALK